MRSYCTSSERAGSIDFSSSTNNVGGSINNTVNHVTGDKVAGDKIVKISQQAPSYKYATITEQEIIKNKTLALKAINEFASEFCTRIPLEGKESNLDLSGRVDAETKSLLKKMAGFKINGNVSYSEDQYKGLIRKQLMNAIQDSRACRERLWPELKDIYFSPVTTGTNKNIVPEPVDHNNDEPLFLFQNKKFLEDEPELLCNGKLSVTVRRIFGDRCNIILSQFFKKQDERGYTLVKGSPLEVSVGEKKFILHFIDGVYRKYCLISSYAALN